MGHLTAAGQPGKRGRAGVGDPPSRDRRGGLERGRWGGTRCSGQEWRYGFRWGGGQGGRQGALVGLENPGGEGPMKQAVNHPRHMVDSPILNIEVIGMLPDIDGQQRRQAGNLDRGLGVSGSADGEPVAFDAQPGPTAAELANRRRNHVLAEGGVTPEGSVDGGSKDAAGPTAPAGSQAMPIKTVIPDLGGVVEQGRLGRSIGAAAQDRDEGSVGRWLSGQQPVERGHVTGMMAMIMEIDRFGRDHRGQRGFGIGQSRQGKGGVAAMAEIGQGWGVGFG